MWVHDELFIQAVSLRKNNYEEDAPRVIGVGRLPQ